ncbi:hypothetical protein N7454_007330 [Penicillium verhagenii]|nr:hypothetical protein N7454_007330 [Penicillium verhagenii]
MGNGAKANQKRERNLKQGKAAPKSQNKTNEQAMSIQCQTCKQTFLQTTKALLSSSMPPTSITKAWLIASLVSPLRSPSRTSTQSERITVLRNWHE